MYLVISRAESSAEWGTLVSQLACSFFLIWILSFCVMYDVMALRHDGWTVESVMVLRRNEWTVESYTLNQSTGFSGLMCLTTMNLFDMT